LIHLPNLFTLVRLFLTPFIARAILSGSYGQAIVLFFIAGVSDAIDGFLARRLKAITPMGAYFDPIADKILLSMIYLALGAAAAIPWWMVGVVLGRDAFILAMACYGLLFTRVRRFLPSIWGKISTFLQISAALAVMVERYGLWSPAQFVLWLMIAGTLVSGFHYAWRAVMLLRANMN